MVSRMGVRAGHDTKEFLSKVMYCKIVGPGKEIITQPKSNYNHPAFNQLLKMAQLASRYHVGDSTWEPDCEEKSTYNHLNSSSSSSVLEGIVTPAPATEPPEYLRGDQDSIVNAVGQAFAGLKQNGDNWLPIEIDVPVADVIQNVNAGADDVNALNSCLRSTTQAEVDAAQNVDENGCVINDTNVVKIFDQPFELTPAALKIAEDYVELYTPFKTSSNNVGPDVGVFLPKLGNKKRSAAVEFSYIDTSDEKNPEEKSKSQDFDEVDDLDLFLNTIDIGVDINGFIRGPQINIIKSPDRFEANAASLQGVCGNYYANDIESTNLNGNDLNTLGILPVETEDENSEGTGQSQPDGQPEDCEKDVDNPQPPYQGLTESTKSKIRSTLKDQVQEKFTNALDVVTADSATYSIAGPADVPTVQQGLTNLSIQGGTPPTVNYTIGNRKIKLRKVEQAKVVQVDDTVRRTTEDPVMKRFSSKYVDKLENSTGQPSNVRKAHMSAKAKNPKLGGNL